MSETQTQTRGQLLNAALKAINPSDTATVLKDLARYTRRISKSTSVPDPDNPGQKMILDKELTPPEFITHIDEDTFNKFLDKLKSCAGNPTKFNDVFCLGAAESATEAAAEPEPAAPKPAALRPSRITAPEPKAPTTTGAEEQLLEALLAVIQANAGGRSAAPEGMEARLAELEKVRTNTKTFLLSLKAKVEALEAKVAALETGAPAQPAAGDGDGL